MPLAIRNLSIGLCMVVMAVALSTASVQAERQQIGRFPSNAASIDGQAIGVVNLDWTQHGRDLAMRVQMSDGHWVDLGRFPRAIVFPALMYAADGRPFVVALEDAPPLYDRKVLLHPVLQDTALGCRLLQLDQLLARLAEVDEDFKGELASASAVIDAQHTLYTVTWAHRFGAVIDQVRAGHPDISKLQDSQYWGTILQSLDHALNVRTESDKRLGEAWPHVTDTELPLLTAKPHYYQASVTDEIRFCLQTSDDPQAMNRCLAQRAEAEEQLFSIVNVQDVLWAAPPPTFSIAFGIGENPYELVGDVKEVLSEGQGKVTFVAWVAFSSRPNHLPTDKAWYRADNEQVLNYSDSKPLILEEASAIANDVAIEFMASDGYWLESQRSVEAFTTLQRFFRLAFEEYLGTGFPFEMLQTLGEETAGAAFGENTRTPRWLTSPGELEMRKQLSLDALSRSESTEAKYESVYQQAQNCVKGLASDVATPQTDIVWSTACDFEPFLDANPVLRKRPETLSEEEYWLQRMLLQVVRLDYAHEIRSALRVGRDDEIDLGTLRCPVP